MSPSVPALLARALVSATWLLAPLCIAGCAHDVLIESTPTGADVRVEGERIGKTPVVFREPFGLQRSWDVEVRHSGYRMARRQLVQREPDPCVSAPLVGCGCASCAATVPFYAFCLPLLPCAVGLEQTWTCVIASAGAWLCTSGLPIGIGSVVGSHLPDRIHIELQREGMTRPLPTTTPLPPPDPRP